MEAGHGFHTLHKTIVFTMSDVLQHTTTPAAETLVTDPATATSITKDAPLATEPAVNGEAPKTGTETAVADAAPIEDSTETAEKAVEPITEGQLAYKGPGLLK